MKKLDGKKYYLFKSGIFYIFIDQDAIKISKRYGLKLTNLNQNILKCGFPTNSLEKYMGIFNKIEKKIVVVDYARVDERVHEYLNNDKILNEITKIKMLDMNRISPLKSFDILRKFKDVIDNE